LYVLAVWTPLNGGDGFMVLPFDLLKYLSEYLSQLNPGLDPKNIRVSNA